jgi:hypothetical protein
MEICSGHFSRSQYVHKRRLRDFFRILLPVTGRLVRSGNGHDHGEHPLVPPLHRGAEGGGGGEPPPLPAGPHPGGAGRRRPAPPTPAGDAASPAGRPPRGAKKI